VPELKTHPGLLPGDILEVNGKLIEITKKVASGGLGAVYKGKFQDSGYPIAIKEFFYSKFYHPMLKINECEKYWEKEGDIIQKQCNSPEPNMRYYASLKLTQFQNPEYYLLFEYIDGAQLNNWFRAKYTNKKDFSAEELILFLDIAMKISRHMYFAHQNGIVHRDLSLDNILIQEKDNQIIPIVIDWGISKEIDGNKMFSPKKPYLSQNTMESTGIFNRGSPPELIGGYEPVAATDIYMLGHILYYIFAGGRYCSFPTTEKEYVLSPRECNDNIPEHLNKIVQSMTQYEPLDRIPNMLDTWNALKQAQDNIKTYGINGKPPQAGSQNSAQYTSPKAQTPKISQKTQIFFDSVNKSGEILYEFLETFEIFKSKHKNIQNTRIISLTNSYQNILLNTANDFEIYVKLKKSPQLNDSYFISMKQNELKSFQKKIQNLIAEFDELNGSVEKFIEEENDRVERNNLNSQAHQNYINNYQQTLPSNSSSTPSSSSQSHYTGGINYPVLFTILIDNNLKFHCTKCKSKIPYGEPFCDECGNKNNWTYDQDEILIRLGTLPKNHKLLCPSEGCGAMIKLDWDNCAMCGLDLWKLLDSKPFFESN
jgi:serine/threonine protein kinase